MPVYGYFLSEADDKNEDIRNRKKIRAYALLNDFVIERIINESKAYKQKPLSKRPKGKKFLKIINNKNIVITVKFSDLFHSAQASLKTIQLFNQKNTELHIIETGGRLIPGNEIESLLIFIKCFADYENKIKRRLTGNAKKNEHRKRGKIPFGFTLQDGELIKKPKEQSIISDMNKMHKEGLGYISIAKRVVEKYNITFSHMGIKKILQRNS